MTNGELYKNHTLEQKRSAFAKYCDGTKKCRFENDCIKCCLDWNDAEAVIENGFTKADQTIAQAALNPYYWIARHKNGELMISAEQPQRNLGGMGYWGVENGKVKTLPLNAFEDLTWYCSPILLQDIYEGVYGSNE